MPGPALAGAFRQLSWLPAARPAAHLTAHSGLLSILQALAYGVYSRDTSQYDERIRAFKVK